jgi:hypothetical protein
LWEVKSNSLRIWAIDDFLRVRLGAERPFTFDDEERVQVAEAPEDGPIAALRQRIPGR